MRMVIAKDYSDLSGRAAAEIAAFIRHNPESLLCFCAGDTPLGTFRELIRLQAKGQVDLSSVYYVGLDEWVGLGRADRGSCMQVMFDTYYEPAGIPAGHIHVFDGLSGDLDEQCAKAEAWISARSGIALTLLGMGMNAHIGFNEPNPPDKEGCAVVSLDDITKTVSDKYFDVPLSVRQGITITWRELKKARTVLLIANGEKKAAIVKRAVSEPMTPAVPASLLQDHDDLQLFLDESAASLLKEDA